MTKVMKVYAVVGFIPWEGASEPAGIYASKEAAEAACVELNKANLYIHYKVFEYDVQE
jgi:hypothetical protein